jgi:hypothetical protein
MSEEVRHSGRLTGLTFFLAEIEPDTLPEENVWGEVARRAEAWQDGRSGWRTGEIQSQLDSTAEARRCRT